MKKKLFLPTLAVLAAAVAAPAWSQTTMKPGLWDINQHMESAGGEMEAAMAKMQKQMAAMSPEQRKMMEDTMARQGVKIGPAASGGGMNVQVCMTREMVERNEMPSQQRGSCKSTSQQRVGNTMKMAFVCSEPPSRGEGQFTFNSPESYTMKMNVESLDQGKARKMSMQSTGTWRGADCGNVKPPAGVLAGK